MICFANHNYIICFVDLSSLDQANMGGAALSVDGRFGIHLQVLLAYSTVWRSCFELRILRDMLQSHMRLNSSSCVLSAETACAWIWISCSSHVVLKRMCWIFGSLIFGAWIQRYPNDVQMMAKWKPNDAQMISKWYPNDVQMISNWQANDGQMMSKGCPNDVKMLPKCFTNDQRSAIINKRERRVCMVLEGLTRK